MNSTRNQIETQATDTNSLSYLLMSEFSTESEPVIDTQIIEGFSSDRSFLIEVCQSFLHCAPERMEAIEAAIEAEDAAALKESAHALKSLSTCLGATHLLRYCRAIETIEERDRLAIAASLFGHVVSEYSKVKAAVQTYQRSLSAAL